jgi:hypothetical protein
VQVVHEFCEVGVQVKPETAVESLDQLGAIDVLGFDGGDSKRVKVRFDEFANVRMALDKDSRRGGQKYRTAARVVVGRVLELLEARRAKQGSSPATQQELMEMVAPACHVAFKIQPRDVVNELEANGFLDVDDKTDLVTVSRCRRGLVVGSTAA